MPGLIGLGAGLEGVRRAREDTEFRRRRERDDRERAVDRRRRRSREDYGLDLVQRKAARAEDEHRYQQETRPSPAEVREARRLKLASEGFKFETEQEEAGYRQYEREFDKRLGRLVMTGDYRPLVDLYNSAWPDGKEVRVTPRGDGAYTIALQGDDGKAEQGVAKDRRELAAMALALRDPKAWLEAQRSEYASLGAGRGIYDKRTGEVRTAEQLGVPESGGGADKRTTAARKHRELLAAGVPKDVALGAAYGTIRTVTDLRGNATLVNVATGRAVGTLRVTTRGVEWVPADGGDGAGARKPPGDMTDDELREFLGIGPVIKEPGGGQTPR